MRFTGSSTQLTPDPDIRDLAAAEKSRFEHKSRLTEILASVCFSDRVASLATNHSTTKPQMHTISSSKDVGALSIMIV